MENKKIIEENLMDKPIPYKCIKCKNIHRTGTKVWKDHIIYCINIPEIYFHKNESLLLKKTNEEN